MTPTGILRIGAPRRRLVVALVATLLAGCAAPQLQEHAADSEPARLDAESAIMPDGYRLPLQHWGESTQATAILLALHGFNDYSRAFADLGPYLATDGILTYAYDQRGFGATAQRGRWAGEERLIADLEALIELLRERHPGVPLFLLGESMGGAVVMAAAAHGNGADGVVLVAPAVWSRDTMNPVQRLTLQVAAHTLPWLELTGRGIKINPSDNLEMLRALGADPLVIKGTRVDALWGVTNIMDRAMGAARGLPGPALLLYGEQDEIIPKNAFCTMLERMPEDATGVRILLYENGWHMLTRDLQGERVMADIAVWLQNQNGPLPSGEEARAGSRRLARLCGA
jgi:alpha-beta hydrolase superfamily lysophospholipase